MNSVNFFFILFMVLTFIILFIYFSIYLFNGFLDKFNSKQRNVLLICLSITLTSTILKPTGFIPNDILEGKDVFLAKRTSSIDCTTVLHLKEGLQFIQKSFCFDLKKQTGSYSYIKDTIWFESEAPFYNYGIILKKDNRDFINLYTNDSIKNILVVLENNLPNK